MLKRSTQVLKWPRLQAESLFCNYPHRSCMQNRLEGYEYCMRHILEDKNSPYKQCSYISTKTAKRCPNAAPKADRKEGYCQEHARKAAALRQKTLQIRRPPETPETLLDDLDHYRLNDHPADPVGKSSKPGLDTPASRFIDYASTSDSDDQLLVDCTWPGDRDSDAESIDSDLEDPLKHAGTYTAEEVAWITRDKLIRLQSLYIDQFKRLQHQLKEKRRKYLHAAKQDKDGSGIQGAKEDYEQRQMYDNLVALRRYHKRHGKEALLHRQSRERRIAMSEGPNYRPPSYPKCVHSEKSEKCAARTLPLSKYCPKHILHDMHQILYQPCGFGDGACQEPVNIIPEQPSCILHAKLEEPAPPPENKDLRLLMDPSPIDVVSTSQLGGQDHLYSQLQLSQLPDQILQEPVTMDTDPSPPLMEEKETTKPPTEPSS